MTSNQVVEHYLQHHPDLIELAQVADCFKGRNITAQSEGTGPAFVNLADLVDGQIAYGQLKHLADHQADPKHYLQEGDVLVATKGTVFKVAVVEEQPFPLVASANLTILRLKHTIRPHYLKLFLESELGQALLAQADTGKAVINISKQNLLRIPIPKLPLVKQDYAISQYLTGLKDYQRRVARAQQEWDKIRQQVDKALF